MSDSDQLPGVYGFDEVDAALTLLPMAARRALDCAGMHLSLSGWQAMPLTGRRALVLLGAAEAVDGALVARCLSAHEAFVRAEPPLSEPAAADGPSPQLLEALPSGHGLTLPRWCELSALDRYVLSQLARRGKRERLAQAFAEISARWPT